MDERLYYTYILSNVSKTLYVGMSGGIESRMRRHRPKSSPGFTRQYNVTMLVYYEEYPTALEAITREKQLKGWTRAKKIALIESMNPEWVDLSAGWFTEE